MPVPVVYRKGTATNATYDYFDLASGIGYKRFYPIIEINSSATTYTLTPQVLDSKVPRLVDQLIDLNGGVLTTILDYDFDLTFVKAQKIAAGKAFVNLTWGLRCDGNFTVNGKLLINIYHVTTGGTETLIGSTATPTKTVSPTNTRIYREYFAIDMTQKQVKKGEKLRFNLQIQGYSSGSSGARYFDIYIDPSNRKDTTASDEYLSQSQDTDIKFDVPFRIDI